MRRRCVGTNRYGADAHRDSWIEGDMEQATPAGAVEAEQAGDQARPRVLQLVHFLAEYDSLRNPPVRAVRAYGLYLRSTALPSVPRLPARAVRAARSRPARAGS